MPYGKGDEWWRSYHRETRRTYSVAELKDVDAEDGVAQEKNMNFAFTPSAFAVPTSQDLATRYHYMWVFCDCNVLAT